MARATRQYATVARRVDASVRARRRTRPGPGVRRARGRRPAARRGWCRSRSPTCGAVTCRCSPAGPVRRDLWTGVRAPAAGDAAGARTARRGTQDHGDERGRPARPAVGHHGPAGVAAAAGHAPLRRRGLPGHVALVDPDPARLLVAACGIADQILAHAVTGRDRVNWLGLELVDDRHWAVQPLGRRFVQRLHGCGAVPGRARRADRRRPLRRLRPRRDAAAAVVAGVVRRGPGTGRGGRWRAPRPGRHLLRPGAHDAVARPGSRAARPRRATDAAGGLLAHGVVDGVAGSLGGDARRGHA